MGGISTDTPTSPPLLSTSSLAALPICSTWPHLTNSPRLTPSHLAPSPVSRTIIVFIFILIEKAEALQGMLHSDAKTGGPAASQALSLLGLGRESELLPWPGCPSCAATAQPGPPYHEQTLQADHLLLQALQLWELATIVIQSSH